MWRVQVLSPQHLVWPNYFRVDSLTSNGFPLFVFGGWGKNKWRGRIESVHYHTQIYQILKTGNIQGQQFNSLHRGILEHCPGWCFRGAHIKGNWCQGYSLVVRMKGYNCFLPVKFLLHFLKNNCCSFSKCSEILVVH